MRFTLRCEKLDFLPLRAQQRFYLLFDIVNTFDFLIRHFHIRNLPDRKINCANLNIQFATMKYNSTYI